LASGIQGYRPGNEDSGLLDQHVRLGDIRAKTTRDHCFIERLSSHSITTLREI
jgi:hypothetical protein